MGDDTIKSAKYKYIRHDYIQKMVGKYWLFKGGFCHQVIKSEFFAQSKPMENSQYSNQAELEIFGGEEVMGEVNYEKYQSQQQKPQSLPIVTDSQNFFLTTKKLPHLTSSHCEAVHEFVTMKFEYFNSQNLVLLMKLANTPRYLEDPKTNKLKEQLEHYWYSSDFNAQMTRVIYKYSRRQAEYQTGRLYSWTESRFHKDRSKMVALQTFPRWVRAALSSEYYWDLDIVNAHPSILLSVARLLANEEKEFPNLTYYCQYREDVLDLMSYYLNLGPVYGQENNRKEAKQTITALFFGGHLPLDGNISYKSIRNKFSFDKLIAEISQIAKILVEEAANIDKLDTEQLLGFAKGNNSYFKIMLALQKNFKLMKSQPEPKNETNRFLACFLQDLERRIMHEIERTIGKDGEREVEIYIHDGCLIKKKIISNLPDQGLIHWDFNSLKELTATNNLNFEQTFPEELIAACEHKIRQEFEIEIKLVVQSFGNPNEFRDRLHAGNIQMNNGYNNQPPLKTFNELCYYYENCRNLCFITERNKFLYGTELMPLETLKHCLDEQNFRNPASNQPDKSYNFIEAYQKLNVRPKFAKIELVKQALLSNIASTTASAFRLNSSPFRSLNAGKNATVDLTKFLFDLEVGFPLFAKENQVNGSLESMEEFQNYLALGRSNTFFLGNEIIYNQICTEPLFPLNIFYSAVRNPQLLLLETYPMAIPYFNHWWILLNENTECFEYVVFWIAKIAKYPGDMSNISGLILYSKQQGIGKSLAVKMTLGLFDPFAQETQSVEQIFARFSDLMEFVLLLHIEDAPRHHIHKHQDELKGRMTADKLFMEKKNHPTYSVTNFCRIMLSTNEDMALRLTPDDRRWAAFECSPNLYQKRGYFDDLARYWKLHQSKCEVMRVLQGLDLSNFDAEKRRPRTRYLEKLMTAGHTASPGTVKPNSSLLLLGDGDNNLEEILVIAFIEGMKECLTKISPEKSKETFATLDIFHSNDIKNKPNYANQHAHQPCYYIKYSLLADMFYLWMYGSKNNHQSSVASHVHYWLLNDPSKANKIHQEFKRVLGTVAKDVLLQNIPSKNKFSYYIFKKSKIPSKKSLSQFNQPVDLFILYHERTLQWDELKKNLPMPVNYSQKSVKYSSQQQKALPASSQYIKPLFEREESSQKAQKKNKIEDFKLFQSYKNSMKLDEAKRSQQHSMIEYQQAYSNLQPYPVDEEIKEPGDGEYNFLEEKMSSLSFGELFKTTPGCEEKGPNSFKQRPFEFLTNNDKNDSNSISLLFKSDS